MSTISTIEDTLITTIKNLSIVNIALFKIVDSLGRKKEPELLNYPAAFVYFVSDSDTGSKPRPITELVYGVLVLNKNVQAESKAAKDIYGLTESVRDAINVKSLSIADVEPFTWVSTELTDYKDGIISYLVKFKTRHYLPVPA